ncbi:MAG: hypothetical protein IKR69_02285 [Bacteroidales bacterium]|nr:hypothetical protein [Bacteroidales bacterium]
MKKSLKLLGIMAMTLAVISCSKELGTSETEKINENQPEATASEDEDKPADGVNVDGEKYLAGFGVEVEGIDSKVSVTLATGALAFEDGDEALVVCGSASGVYVYDSASAVFSPKAAADAVEVSGQEAQVYYPAAEFALNAGAVTFTMPAAVVAGDAADLGDKLPLCGTIPASENPVASFKNLGSILYVRFNSAAADGETITALELSGSGVNITGSGAVTWADTDAQVAGLEPVLAALSGDGAGTSLTIDCSLAPKHLSSADYQEFFFFLPQSGSFADMQLKAVYGKTDGSNSYTLYELVSRTSAMTLGRGKLKKLEKSLNGFFSGGDGSSSHPYLISSCDDFKALSTMGNVTADASVGNRYYEYNSTAKRNFFRSSGANYQQTADLDFENADITNFMVGIAGSNGEAASFKGHYDGNSKKISNFSITTDKDWAGLFANMQGEVKNLELNTISVSGNQAVGGIVGWLNGKVTDCSVTGTSSVTGTNGAAGIAANIRNSSEVSGCTNYAAISGEGNIGGIVGYMANAGGKILLCNNYGTVTGTANSVGGIVGQSYQAGAKVYGCQNFADVTSSGNFVGGLVGNAGAGVDINATSNTYCRNEGNVTGAAYTGGIVGQLGGNSIACTTNTGTVEGTFDVGGIVGYKKNGGIWSNTYNEGNVTAQYNVGGLAGRQDASGISGNVLTNPNNHVWNKGNVTATGKDGNLAYAGGLIGRMNGGALGDASVKKTVENYGNVTSTGGGQGVGGMVGYISAGTIAHCMSDATVIGNQKCVGGAIGWMAGGKVYNCYAKGIVKGQGQVGGFVGYLFASANSYIINCAAGAERVVATNKNTNDGVGGFVGYMNQSSAENADKQAVIANCVVWEGIIKAPNEDNTASNKIRVGGFAGVGNAQSGGKANSLIQVCYYQGLPTTVGYGGAEDDNSLPTVNSDGTGVVGGFIGYAGGTTKDCYCDRAGSTAYKLNGSGSVSYGGRMVTNIVYGRAMISWDVNTSAGSVAKNTVYFDGLLNTIVDSVGSLGDITLSQWTSYTVGTDKYYYPDILTSMGEIFYKK